MKRDKHADRPDIEPRLVAFAAHLGDIAGAMQGKAEGWLDPTTLKRQIAEVRDHASELLGALYGRRASSSKTKAGGVAKRAPTRGRSGGVVDAPGKKHRKPPPVDPAAKRAKTQAANMRTSISKVKGSRRRGRG